MRIKTLLTLVVVAVAATAFAATAPFASAKKAHKAGAAVKISARVVPGLGKVLVDAKGRTLYMFAPDKDKKVTCVKVCAKLWPPVMLPKGGRVITAGGVKKGLIGSDPDPAGGRVVTYHGWPLYGYIGDTKDGVAFGQAVNMNGGLWFVLSPSGKVIRHKAHKKSGGGSGGSGSGGGSGTTTTTTSTSTSTSANGGGGGGACEDADNDGDQNAGGPDDGDGCL